MTGPALLDALRERFPAAVVETHDQHGDHTVVVRRESLAGILRHCRDVPALAFDMLTDLTAVDYLKFPGREDGPRFEVVYHLYSLSRNHRLRVKVAVEEDGIGARARAGAHRVEGSADQARVATRPRRQVLLDVVRPGIEHVLETAEPVGWHDAVQPCTDGGADGRGIEGATLVDQAASRPTPLDQQRAPIRVAGRVAAVHPGAATARPPPGGPRRAGDRVVPRPGRPGRRGRHRRRRAADA